MAGSFQGCTGAAKNTVAEEPRLLVFIKAWAVPVLRCAFIVTFDGFSKRLQRLPALRKLCGEGVGAGFPFDGRVAVVIDKLAERHNVLGLLADMLALL